MGPPSYMRSVVDRNIVVWRIPVLSVWWLFPIYSTLHWSEYVSSI